VYVSGAALAQESLGDALGGALMSPVGIVLQVAMLVGVIALLRIDWTSRLARNRPHRPTAARRAHSEPMRHRPRSTSASR
jgi:hypothetical protein